MAVTCGKVANVLPAAEGARAAIPKTAKPYLYAEGTDVNHLITPDGKSGTHICFGEGTGTQSWSWSAATSPIPSAQRIVSIVRSAESYLVSDGKGSICRLSASEEPPHKKNKRDNGTSHASSEKEYMWEEIVSASQTPSGDGSGTDSFAALFAKTSYGGPGWSGLARALNPSHLVNSRQYYGDVRLVDVEQKSVVRSYGTSHPSTGIVDFTQSNTQELLHCVLVAEGCLATLYDVRCASAVLTLDEVRSVAEDESLRERLGGHIGPAVPGRLTSTSGRISDVCALPTASSAWEGHEVVLAIDRAVCVYDVRKFTKQFTSSNVLKYVVNSVALTANGTEVVCSGIDSEVRVIPIQRSKEKVKPQKGSEDDGALGGTFRTRIDSSMACETSWCGGWVTSENGVSAIGLSTANEVFIAK
ncbi:hypothetical protein ADEAN_000209400 [Angomonas deanei]|uniref:WD domain, G-beta repeat n=1 Tax=Angomonas deanei TaxID=59799 RepID=A0A7G2C7B4_9TRYP|nr:hypothetical protein ADEAN_000209400 [Angomonas deanei]